MTGCCVTSCKNRTESGFRLFRLPQGKRNEQKRRKWMDFINRTDLPSKAHICEAHFEATQFELGRQDGRKLLKWNAVPTILVKEFQSPPPKRRPSSDFQPFQNKAESEADENNQFESYCELERKLRTAKRTIQLLKKRITQMEETYEKLFDKDQVDFLITGSHRGVEWSDSTINKGLRLYMACGRKGYEEIRNQKLPYPSIRTLQQRIQNFTFNAGVLDEVFDLLAIKISTFNSKEKFASLVLDEIAIQPQLQYDNSVHKVIGRPTMSLSGGVDSSEEVATHALVFMLAGLTSRWKQTIQYEFTANSYSAEEALQILMNIIRKASSIGITVKTIVSDMGPQNRAVWRLLNIAAHRHGQISNYTKHPVNPDKLLYIMPDSVHLFKNVATALIKHKEFHLAESLVQKYELPSNTIYLEAIEEVFKIEQRTELKIAPRLKDIMFCPTHFDKMNVNLAFGLFHNDTAAAITYYISKKQLNPTYQTTSWFCKLLFHWFCLMSARHEVLGISKTNEMAYKETIAFFKDIIEVIRGIHVEKGTWLPFQCGTQTALDLQAEFLEAHNFKFLLLGRLTQDCLENLFSVCRSRAPIPGPREFKTSLRLILLSQYETKCRGNYFTDNAEAVVKYCKNIKTHETYDTEDSMELFYFDICDESLEITDNDSQCLYHLLGNILHKLKAQTCNECFQPLLSNNIDEKPYNALLTQLKEHKENSLTYATMALHEYIKKAELFFREIKKPLLANKINTREAAVLFLNKYSFVHLNCHNIIQKIVNLFMRTRFFFALRDFNKKFQQHSNGAVRASRSLAMRSFLKKIEIKYYD